MDAGKRAGAWVCGGGLDGAVVKEMERKDGKHMWGKAFCSEVEAEESAKRAGWGWRSRPGKGTSR